jgi:predicted dehydrogenase
MNTAECRTLIAARDRTGVRIGEAFMVRTHPQWLRARDLVRSGDLGPLRTVISAFSYYNRDPANVRNIAEWGGGALMDIGCYPIQVSRFLFGEEPVRVFGAMEFDPEFHVDRLTSGLLEFPSGHAVFSVGTQMTAYQRVHAICEKGRVEVLIPFNAPPDQPCRILIDDGSDLSGGSAAAQEFEICDQYTIQGDQFSQVVLNGGELPTPLEDSLANMSVIDRMFAFVAGPDTPVIPQS